MAADSNDLPLVSVVIPTHNRARLVLESIASVRTQEGAGSCLDWKSSSSMTHLQTTLLKSLQTIRISDISGYPSIEGCRVQDLKGSKRAPESILRSTMTTIFGCLISSAYLCLHWKTILFPALLMRRYSSTAKIPLPLFPMGMPHQATCSRCC